MATKSLRQGLNRAARIALVNLLGANPSRQSIYGTGVEGACEFGGNLLKMRNKHLPKLLSAYKNPLLREE